MSKLLFVCGFPSGGTDLTKTILNAHPCINLTGEIPLLINLTKHQYSSDTKFTTIEEIDALQSLLQKLDTWHNLPHIDFDFAPLLAQRSQLSLKEIMHFIFSGQDDSQVWGSKTPQFTENIKPLLSLFPDAQFLIVVRDIRDVVLSWQKKWGKDMLLTAHKWQIRMKMGWNITRQMPPDQFLFIKFEDILLNSEATAREICDFLKIPFSERMLAHHQYTTETIDGKINYGQKIDQTNQAKWVNELPNYLLTRIEAIAFPTMQLFNYSPINANKFKPITRFEKVRGLLRDLLSLIFIGNRASNRNFIQKRLHEIISEIRKRLVN